MLLGQQQISPAKLYYCLSFLVIRSNAVFNPQSLQTITVYFHHRHSTALAPAPFPLAAPPLRQADPGYYTHTPPSPEAARPALRRAPPLPEPGAHQVRVGALQSHRPRVTAQHPHHTRRQPLDARQQRRHVRRSAFPPPRAAERQPAGRRKPRSASHRPPAALLPLRALLRRGAVPPDS